MSKPNKKKMEKRQMIIRNKKEMVLSQRPLRKRNHKNCDSKNY